MQSGAATDNTGNIQLRHRRARYRSHLVADSKSAIETLYGLDKLVNSQMTGEEAKEAIRQRVGYLLEDDRFMCHADRYESCEWRFTSAAIAKLVFRRVFADARMRGSQDASWLLKFNGVFICLITTSLRHGLTAWSTGEYVKPPKFEESSVGGESNRQPVHRNSLPLTRQYRCIRAPFENV